MDNEFWIPKPKMWDFLTLSILIPVIFSSIGLVLMSVETMVFAQFRSLPENIRFYVSVTSAIFLALGGELGSVSNNVALYQKYIKSKMSNKFEWDIVTGWEWIGFFTSWLATSLSMLIASSTRPDAFTMWQDVVTEWLILPLMLLAVGDVIFGTIELGIRLGEFNLRMTNWIVMRKEYQDEIKYLAALEASNKATKIMPVPAEAQNKLRCWCGKELKNERAYNAHLRYHKNETKELKDAVTALEFLQNKYQHIEDTDFDFPSLSDIIEWRS